jgi:hypothetical protein
MKSSYAALTPLLAGFLFFSISFTFCPFKGWQRPENWGVQAHVAEQRISALLAQLEKHGYKSKAGINLRYSSYSGWYLTDIEQKVVLAE